MLKIGFGKHFTRSQDNIHLRKYNALDLLFQTLTILSADIMQKPRRNQYSLSFLHVDYLTAI